MNTPWFDDPNLSDEEASAHWESLKAWLPYAVKIQPTPGGRYIGRRALERRMARSGAPGALVEAYWSTMKIFREPLYPIPLEDPAHTPFHFTHASYADHLRMLGGLTFRLEHLIEGYDWQRQAIPTGLRVEAMREEAIASCLLDGVEFDPVAAREMISNGRLPLHPGEEAVHRCFDTLENRLVGALGYPWDEVRPEQLLAINAWLTRAPLERPDPADLLRRRDDCDESGSAPVDLPPPPAAEVWPRLEKLCAFMTGANSPDYWPLLTANLLHFWVAYERPFSSANGRTARAIFYAFLARHYVRTGGITGGSERLEAMRLVPISPRLWRLGTGYPRLFESVVEDGNDVGYFVHAALRILTNAVDDLERSLASARQTRELLSNHWPNLELNERQVDVIARIVRHPDGLVRVGDHRRRSGVAYETARTDLLRLVEMGLLVMRREGRAFVYAPAEPLKAVMG